MAESVFERVAFQVAQKAAQRGQIPPKSARFIPAFKKAVNGDIGGAIIDAIGAITGQAATGNQIAAARRNPLSLPTPLLGGITVKKAREIFEKSSATDYAKKNLWFLRITDLKDGGTGPVDHNMFATDVSYAPITVSGEAIAVGSGSFDKVNNSERVEMRITTLDDTAGTIKSWFQERHARMCKTNGLFGLPVDYLFRVDVLHAFIEEGTPGAYFDTYIMRPGGIEYDLSRREDALQELQITLVQYDTFATLS